VDLYTGRPSFCQLFGVDNLTIIQYTGRRYTLLIIIKFFLMICKAVFVASFFLFLMRKKRSVQPEKIVFMLIKILSKSIKMIIYDFRVLQSSLCNPNDILFMRTLGDMSPMD
jgi:hypothetical protein